MALLSPAQHAALAANARRSWRVDAVVLGVVALLLRLPAFFASRSLVFDDGVFASSALAMRAGEAPFRDVFSSQGPLFLPLVWVGDLVGFRTLDAPRVLAVAAGVLLTIASYSCARQLTSRANALLAAGLVTTAGSVLWVTGPINADGPALALSVLAVAFALRYRHAPRTLDAVYVGLAAGGALSIKALAVPAVVIAGLVVLASHRRVLDALVAALTAVALYVVAAVPWGLDRVWDQSFAYHDEAVRQDSAAGALGKILRTLWERDLPVLVALALAAVFLVVARVRRSTPHGVGAGEVGAHDDADIDAGSALARAQLPAPTPDRFVAIGLALWVVLVVALLVWEPAMWRAHVAHLIPPLALLAALRPAPWKVLLVAAIIVTPIWAVQNHSILWPGADTDARAGVVARLHSLPVDAQVISDDPGLAWRADRRVPGNFADPSFQRIDNGDLTAASVAAGAASPDVCAVVVTSPKHFGRFTTLGEKLGAQGYLPEKFGKSITLYARPGCDPS
jgi:hypothetical protein